ncbi:armadillo repeat protein [Colletotrichum tabaci]|uniref:Armadillo repeat protein n=1 Tax=Colletotrichum tabaci TaxID=1209068 RepID=A0AAV9TS01_9PEZI
MARLSNPPILSQLLSARGFAEQTSALRALKNDVVGHAQKKEMWAGLGALDPVVEILNAARSPVKVNGKDTRPSASSRWLSEEETLRLQALQLLASFANGGTAFVEPLLVAGALPAVLHNICPISNAPLLVTAALRVVLNIIEAAALSQPTSPVDTQALADAVFASEHIESFNSILCSTPTVPEHQTQVTLVASIISQLCRDERHQLAMASQGVLDSLATRLASIAVAEGHVVPYAEVLGRVDRMSDFIPEPAPSSSILAPVLEALATIISDSRYRACMLLCSPAIMAIFPAMKFTPSKEVRAPWNSLELQAAPPVVKSPLIDADTALKWTILERTPSILARMITDSEPLQKAAFDCGAVKCYSKLLKDAYEPIPPSAYAKVWSPQVDANMEMGNTSPSCALGPGGQPPLLAHRVRMRESALKAIGALAAGKDEYRKAFVEQDVVAHIVQSLSPTPGKPSNPKDRSKPTEPDGPVRDGSSPDHNSGYGSNPLSVLIAGCHAVRMLSRSVSILRTSLVDYAVAVPLFRFLRHPNVDVQIAATAAICNLVTSVSSMREVLADRGVMKILCEHAHSLNPALRLNALWALKHYVHDVDPETKKHCLEELESGWLVQLICDDTEDDALFLARSKMDKHTAVDTGDDLDGDIEMDQADPLSRSWISSTMPPQDADGRSSAKLRQAEAKLAALREAEINPLRKARNDDLAIQEQGLDFIRNMIGTTSKEDDNETKTAEMIDYLFSELGQDRFFDILARKLQAKVLHPTSRRSTGPGRETRVLYPQAKIIQAVVYVLVHMAASVPRHKQLVVAQTDLLKLLANHFNSKDKEVRVALCHLITNLTCPGDGSRTSAQRVYELKKLGFLTKLEGLEDDCELDVRERAKGAVCQMKQNNSY